MPRKADPAPRLEPAASSTLKALNRVILEAAPFVKGGEHAVLGEGPMHPDLALVGEQPGDQEDLEGHPFVGPAGKILDRSLAEAGIARSHVYVTNAVKHFKFEQRGKRRLHSKPNAGEVRLYRWWLEKELDFVKPKVTVAMGSTAILALAGKALPIARNRGPKTTPGRCLFLTTHPSSLLRIPDSQDRHRAYAWFVADLRQARELASRMKNGALAKKRDGHATSRQAKKRAA